MQPQYQLICDFMHYGFLPKQSVAEKQAEFYRSILTDDSIPVFDSQSAHSARKLAVCIMRERFEARGVDQILLGLSAGFDSRGLLGVALDILAPESIIAFTTGQVGNNDFEKARLFTEGILPSHHLIETQAGTYSVQDWVSRIQKRPGQTGLIYGISQSVGNNLKEYKRLCKVTGYLGDALSGKRLHGEHFEDWDSATDAFVQKNEVFRPSAKRIIQSLVPEDYDPHHLLPDGPLLPKNLMTYNDQLDLCYRQHQRIRANFPPTRQEELHPLEFTEVKPSGRTINVYDDPRWQKSYLLMPVEERLYQKHYKWMLKQNWPEIFRDLVDPEDPRYAPPKKPEDPKARLKHSAKTALHTNWESLWKDNENFNEFARELITSLARRDVIYWLDPMELLKEFDKDVLGLGKILWCLVSLELNFRAGGLPIPETKPAVIKPKSRYRSWRKIFRKSPFGRQI